MCKKCGGGDLTIVPESTGIRLVCRNCLIYEEFDKTTQKCFKENQN